MKLSFIGLIFSSFLHAPAQSTPNLPLTDSLQLTRRQADSLFLSNNLLLLAERFRVEAAQAQISQAKLFDNPSVGVELSTYNSQTKRVFDVGRVRKSSRSRNCCTRRANATNALRWLLKLPA